LNSIEYKAFYGCNNLKDLELPESLTTIGLCAFSSPFITTVVIPKNVVSMTSGSTDSAFSSCKNLETVIFEEGMTRIPGGALQGCALLEKVYIPMTVKNIYNNAFKGCNGLSIYGFHGSYAETYANMAGIPFIPLPFSSIDSMIVVPKYLTRIDEEAFSDCRFTSVKLSEGILSIGEKAFINCNCLEYIVIPGSVTYIADNAFDGIPNLTIYCEKDSYAESYAIRKGIVCIAEYS